MINIYAGKWWVWKSTLAASTAVFQANVWKKILAIDYDGWKALSRVLQTPIVTPNVFQETWVENLIISWVQPLATHQSRYDSANYNEYIKQFPNQYWLVGLNDMVQEFFGITTDIHTLEKYIALVSLLDKAKQEWIDEVILDVEPTVWLQRLIQSSGNIARSLSNLNKQWWVKLKMIGAAWPDIKQFIESEYVKRSSIYMESFTSTQEDLSNAIFSVVSIPEPEPVSQAIEDVIPIIQSIQWSIKNVILNNVGRLDSIIENQAIDLANSCAVDLNAKFITISHDSKMFSTTWDRINILNNIGKRLFS